MAGGFSVMAWSLAACSASGNPDGVDSGVVWEEPIEIASGEAHRGPWRMNESDFRFVDDPTAAIGADGRVGVAWVDQARQDVFFQTFDSSGEPRFGEPVNVSNSPDIFSWLPRVVFSREDPDRVYLLWQEIVFSGGSHGGEIFFSRSSDGGRNFGDTLNLSETTAGAGKGRTSQHRWHNGSLDLAEGPGGELYAVWTEYEGALRFSRSNDGGETFSNPLHIAGDDETPARGPSLTVDPEERIHLAWTVGEDAAADIRYSCSTDAGESFSEPRIVTETGGFSDAPKLAVDSEGTIHLAYGEREGGLFGSRAVFYARSSGGEGEFEPAREVSRPLPDNFDGAGFPALVADGKNNVYLTWELFPGRGDRSQGLGIVVSMDRGDHFSAPSVIPGTFDPDLGINGSQQGLLMQKLAAGNNGAVAVVNGTFRENESSRVYLFRGTIDAP